MYVEKDRWRPCLQERLHIERVFTTSSRTHWGVRTFVAEVIKVCFSPHGWVLAPPWLLGRFLIVHEKGTLRDTAPYWSLMWTHPGWLTASYITALSWNESPVRVTIRGKAVTEVSDNSHTLRDLFIYLLLFCALFCTGFHGRTVSDVLSGLAELKT